MRRPPLQTLIVATCGVVLALAACDGGPSSPPPAMSASPAPSTAPSDGSVMDPSPTPTTTVDPGVPLTAADVVPGIYLHPDLSVSGDKDVTILRGDMPCQDLIEIVEAGEWTVLDRQEAAIAELGDGQPFMTILTLTRGAETAFAWLAGGDQCAARIARTTTASVTATGAAAVRGTVARDEPYCVVTDTSILLGAVFRPAAGPSLFVQVTAPVRTGTLELVPTDVEIGIERRALDAPELAGILITGFRETDGGRFTELYEATSEDAAATLEVRSLDPFEGTLRAVGFEGPRGRLDLEVAVACHIPGSALERTAEAAAIAAAATPTPTVPPPSLGTIAAADPGTVVASGGPIAGKYTVGEADLICFHDPEAGTWALTTVGSGAHSLFVTVAAPAGGGSSDAISIGLVVGDGSGDRTALVDMFASPPVGIGRGTIRVVGPRVTVQAEGRTPEGVALALDVTCRP